FYSNKQCNSCPGITLEGAHNYILLDSPVAREQLCHYRNAAEMARSELAAFLVKYECAQAEILDLKSTLASKDISIQDLKAEVGSYKENDARQSSLLSSMQSRLQEMEKESGTIAMSKKQVDLKAQAILQENLELKEKVHEQEISGMHEEIATLKEQIATFKETANVHEMELKANRETIMRLVSELSKEQKKTATYSQDMEKLSEVSTADKQNLEKEIRKLQDRLAACQSAWETSQKELSHLKECCNENEEYLKSSTEEARAAKSLHRTFKEQIATLLGSNSILVSPSEEDIIEKIREMCHDEESKKTVSKLAEMQETQNKLHQETLQKTRKAESKSETLHNQLMRLEGELVSGDVIRDSLKLEKQNYLQFLDQLSEKLNLDCVAADIGFDMRLEAILARVEQLIKLEGDTLRENKIMAHNLQRKLKTQKEQLDNKVLQMKLLRQKIVQLEEEKQVRTALAVERDEANLTLRKLQKKVDRLQNELALAREANTDLKVKLADANELKIRTLEQDKTIEELSKSQEKLEKMKTKAEKQLSSAKSELQLKEREAKEDKEKARNMLESVSSELATFKSALDEVMKKERQLADFREVVSQMLGLNTAAVALPDYEIITRLERLIHSHQHHFVPCICFKDMPVRQDGPLQLLH
uniref:Coiled-coil domain containing 170 n=1 Tax=Varanus komodoensis TaxID=61221 RepID=A0A8D2Q975_VARKO